MTEKKCMYIRTVYMSRNRPDFEFDLAGMRQMGMNVIRQEISSLLCSLNYLIILYVLNLSLVSVFPIFLIQLNIQRN